MEDTWKEIEPRTRTFRLGNEPELVHIIKTGYSDTFMVVFESGYDHIGDIKIMTSKEILESFEIDLSNWADFTNAP